jgi:hypothetical protein
VISGEMFPHGSNASRTFQRMEAARAADRA